MSRGSWVLLHLLAGAVFVFSVLLMVWSLDANPPGCRPAPTVTLLGALGLVLLLGAPIIHGLYGNATAVARAAIISATCGGVLLIAWFALGGEGAVACRIGS